MAADDQTDGPSTPVPAEPERAGARPRRRLPARRTGVFISYRREDSSGFAGRLHESLSSHFGAERVFRDVDTIEPGADFPTTISTHLDACGAFVVVIGREWLVDLRGRRRLDDPADWVRVELEAALQREGVLVVPVLVENATLPAADDLPPSLAPLLRRNALEVSDSRWDYDVKRLADRIEAVVGPPATTWPVRLRQAVVPRTALGAVARIVVAAAVLLGLVLGVVPLLRPSAASRPMTGDYNIAVAEFEGVDAAGRPVDSTEAHALAQSVHDLLEQRLAAIRQENLDLKLRGPDETGRVQGTTPARRAQAAATKAKQIQADVVVYGTLRTDVPNQFSAEFFLSDLHLQNAEELFGQHELGSTIVTAGDIGRNPVIRRELREQILARTNALAEFLVGLSFYEANEPQPALDHFEAARATAGWDDHDGTEVLYLFLGNTAGKLGDLGRASTYYDQALGLNPQYARALLGRAEVVLHQSWADCEAGNPEVDVGGVRAALDTFRSALSAEDQPALSDVPTKVVFGEGRVHRCLSQALVDDAWADAEREFQTVIDVFTKGNVRVRELAAQSYAELGFVHLPAVGVPNPDDRLRQALTDYQRAIELSAVDDRKAFFSSMRGSILARLGDVAQADEAYLLAIRLTDDEEARAAYEKDRQALTAPPAG